MIKISKKSWHYRLYKSVVHDAEPTSLCGYFWALILGMIFYPLDFFLKSQSPVVRAVTLFPLLLWAGWLLFYVPASAWLGAGFLWLPTMGHHNYVATSMNYALAASLSVWSAVLCYLAGAAVWIAIHRAREEPSSFAAMTLARFHSLKDGSCPRVEVIE